MGLYIGIDTSCYTTSAACVGPAGILVDLRKLLEVSSGERGLRQSDGVFQHVRNLAVLLPELLQDIDKTSIQGICVSAQPRPAADSYMPVFAAGILTARTLAAAFNVPLIESSHQQGHIRAALYGNEPLQSQSFLGLHISGGTTEIVGVEPSLKIRRLGGTGDLHAGQFVDRVGVTLGLRFPAGKELEQLAGHAVKRDIKLPASVDGLTCSFSGVETRAQSLLGCAPNDEIAYAVYDCMARTFAKMIQNASAAWDGDGAPHVLLAGGVASSALLRSLLVHRLKDSDVKLFFANPKLSSDNAVGTALIAMDLLNGSSLN